MVWHLIWERGAKNWGEFVISPLPLLRESVRDVVLLSRKPLTVALYARAHEYFCKFPCRVDPCSCLGGIDVRFTEINFCIQPSAVVLSVIDNTQSPELRRPLAMLIHGVTIAANNSNRLFDARKSRLLGGLNRHTNPWSL